MRSRTTTLARALAASATWLALSAQALPVEFTAQRFETSATAIAGAMGDAQFGDDTAQPLPLTTSAIAYDGANYAAGVGIAAQGLLSTSAEASSQTGLTSATGTAGFTGDFSGGGIHTFRFHYTSDNFAQAGTFADSTLSFTLMSNGATLLSTVIPVTDFFSLSLSLAGGASHTVSLFLTSEASALASTSASAQNVATLGFQVTAVPEPTTWLLMLAGFLVVSLKARSDRWALAGRAAL